MARPIPVAAGGLDHRLSGLEFAALLGRLDHAQRKPVLDRAQRIEGLDLDVEVHVRRREPVDLDDRRVADSPEDALELGQGGRSFGGAGGRHCARPSLLSIHALARDLLPGFGVSPNTA
jgi:hypothetical protein